MQISGSLAYTLCNCICFLTNNDHWFKLGKLQLKNQTMLNITTHFHLQYFISIVGVLVLVLTLVQRITQTSDRYRQIYVVIEGTSYIHCNKFI